jgi:hypothetical protein
MIPGSRRWLLRGMPGAIVTALAVSAYGLAPTTVTAAAAAPRASSAASVTATGPVSPNPATGTPALANTGTTEQVRQLVECGGVMYAVGTFTEITQGGSNYTRDNIFSFSATAPYTITSWDQDVNGEVNSIQLTSDCSHAYIGGSFTEVDGESADNIAYIRTYNNSMVKDWGHDANNTVNTVLLTPNGHLLVGGLFTSINGSSKAAYYASLNPSTGANDGYLSLNISGHYVYTDAGPNYTQVYNQQLSPDGQHVLVEGVFTRVQTNARQQIFMLNLAANHGNVSEWYSNEFNQYCAKKHPFYIKAAAWSPDMSTVYIADTGKALYNWNGHTYPLTGLCDAVAAFSANRVGGLTHEWINYSGCDSFYSAAADNNAVYVGGHERWADNPNDCNAAGPGSIPAPGMGGFTPGATGGSLLLNSAGTAGLYSRGRGEGADDMLLTSAGLWIASDNEDGTQTCGGVSGLAGICFLPYSS